MNPTLGYLFSVPESESNQQSASHIKLELMPRQPQQGNADRALVENDFGKKAIKLRKFSTVF